MPGVDEVIGDVAAVDAAHSHNATPRIEVLPVRSPDAGNGRAVHKMLDVGLGGLACAGLVLRGLDSPKPDDVLTLIGARKGQRVAVNNARRAARAFRAVAEIVCGCRPGQQQQQHGRV